MALWDTIKNTTSRVATGYWNFMGNHAGKAIGTAGLAAVLGLSGYSLFKGQDAPSPVSGSPPVVPVISAPTVPPTSLTGTDGIYALLDVKDERGSSIGMWEVQDKQTYDGVTTILTNARAGKLTDVEQLSYGSQIEGILSGINGVGDTKTDRRLRMDDVTKYNAAYPLK